ncbi:hypothetical protein OUZ56_007519 [Daphnia magna]|uniref:Uncharacterized protein n=1 Tax=Daphnia magna TaxID=35525 RepID=A0ABR0AA68_9CRUS|nr:hypothetical protein OUZ56_007519 [Daphnia magna]
MEIVKLVVPHSTASSWDPPNRLLASQAFIRSPNVFLRKDAFCMHPPHHFAIRNPAVYAASCCVN